MEASHYKLIGFFEAKAYILTLCRAAHIVNICKSICTYLRFQDCHFSCHCAMAVCKDKILNLEHFLSPVYTIDNYYNIYF